MNKCAISKLDFINCWSSLKIRLFYERIAILQNLLTECVEVVCADLPSTTHWTDAGGLELAVSHLKWRLSLTLASLGPSIVTLSGATEKKRKFKNCTMELNKFWSKDISKDEIRRADCLFVMLAKLVSFS